MYQIIIQPSALKMLEDINDKRIRSIISEKIDKLASEPEKQGKPLLDALWGYRSVRAVGQRYRIIYKVEKNTVTVYIIAVGIRKEGDKRDVYKLTKKMVNH